MSKSFNIIISQMVYSITWYSLSLLNEIRYSDDLFWFVTLTLSLTTNWFKRLPGNHRFGSQVISTRIWENSEGSQILVFSNVCCRSNKYIELFWFSFSKLRVRSCEPCEPLYPPLSLIDWFDIGTKRSSQSEYFWNQNRSKVIQKKFCQPHGRSGIQAYTRRSCLTSFY